MNAAYIVLTLLLLQRLSHCQPESETVSCGLTRRRVEALLDQETRTWTVDDAALAEHDLQEILDCAQEQDVIILQTEEIIRPKERLQIRKGVTIRGKDGDAEVARKASMTCPENHGLMVIRGVDLKLHGIQIADCLLSENATTASIIETVSCGNTSLIAFTDVDIHHNDHLSGSIPLNIDDASCYTMQWTRVSIQSNVYTLSGQLASSNHLRDVRFSNNSFDGDGPSQPMIALPEGSNTTITGCTVEDHSGTMLQGENVTLSIDDAEVRRSNVNGSGVFSIVGGAFVLSNSRFEDNRCTGLGGALFFDRADADLFNVKFRRNSAENGGALYVAHPRRLRCEVGRFEKNVASSVGGALYIDRGSETTAISITDTLFLNNRASEGGGAVHADSLTSSTFIIDDSRFSDNGGDGDDMGDGGALLLSRCEDLTFALSSSVLDSNRGLIGGGAYFDDVSGTLLFTDVRVSNNRAKSIGGGMSFWNGGGVESNVTMEFVNFRRNSADDDYGGGVHGSGDAVEFTIFESNFRSNEAPLGAGLYFTTIGSATVENCVFEVNTAKVEGGGLWIRRGTVLLLFTSRLVRNRAESGGGIYANDVEVLLVESLIEGNKASRNGGGVMLFGRGGIAAILNVSLVGNKASIGGGVCSNEFESIEIESETKFRSNEAELYGGGFFAVVARGGQTASILDSGFDGNRASVGGGAAFRIDGRRKKKKDASDNSIQIRNVVFEHNRAELAGGGYFIDDVRELDTDCPLPDLTKPPDGHSFTSSGYQCASFLHNRIGSNGYGANIASESVSFTAILHYLNDTEDDIEPGERYRISNWRPGAMLPIIEIVTIDFFRQGPAPRDMLDIRRSGGPVNRLPPPRRKQEILAKVESPEKLIFNQLSTDVSSGKGNITVGVPLKQPGDYSMFLWVERLRTPLISFNVSIRNCSINEESKIDGTLCIACDTNHYNLMPQNSSCSVCPEDCSCNHWGLAPKKDYWMASPCASNPRQCLSEDACNYDEREKNFEAFFSRHEPTCDLSPQQLDDFNKQQCNEGFEGLLCGSCSDGFGQFAMTCYECLSMAVVIVYLLGTVAWLLVVCSAASVGNLTDVGDGTTSGTMHGAATTEASPASASTSGAPSVTHTASLPALAVAQRNVTETVKLFLNFAQVNGIALTINAQWTSIMERALRSLNFVGAVSVQTTISLDCLFPKEASMPRSIKRSMVTLLIPFAVLSIMSVYWIVRLHHQLDVLRRRLILSLAVVFYVSYIGWIEQLAAALHCVRISAGDNHRHRYWSEDTSVICYQDSHAVLLWVFVFPMLLVVVLAFPISSAVYLYLKRRRKELTSLPVREAFGFMYIAYRDGCVYWECITLLRKAALALVIVFGASLGSRMQGLTAVCILVFSLYLQTRLLPFRDDYPTLNRLEIFSLLVCNFTFISGLYLGDETIRERGRMAVSLLAILLMFGFVAFFAYVVAGKALAFMKLTLEADGQRVENDGHVSIFVKWMRHRVHRMSTFPV